MLDNRREWLAGAFVGVSLLLKPLLWPLLLLFVARRLWRAATGVALVVLVGYGLVVLLVGFRPVWEYVRVVGPSIARALRDWCLNISLWGVGPKLFEGTSAPGVQNWIEAGPFVASPLLASITSIGVPLVVLATALGVAAAMPDLEGAVALLVCAAILVSPLAWEIDLVLVALPVAHVINRLCSRCWPRVPTALAAAVVVLLLPSSAEWMGLAAALAGKRLFAEASVSVPPFLALLTCVPTVAVLCLGGLVATLRQTTRPGEPPTGARAR